MSSEVNAFFERVPRRIVEWIIPFDARLHRLFGLLVACATVGYFWDLLSFVRFGVGTSAVPTKSLYAACAVGSLALLTELLGIAPRVSAWIVYWSVASAYALARPISDATDFETAAAAFWVAVLPLPRQGAGQVSGLSRKVLVVWFWSCCVTGSFLGWFSNRVGAPSGLRFGLAMIVALACWPSRSGVRKLGLTLTVCLALGPLFVGARPLRHLLVTFAFLIMVWEPELSSLLPTAEQERGPPVFAWTDAAALVATLLTGIALFGGRSSQSDVARHVLQDVGLRIDQRYAERDMTGNWVLAAATNHASLPLERLEWPARTRELLTYLSDNPWHVAEVPDHRYLRNHIERDLRARFCEKYAVPRLEIRYEGFDQTTTVGAVSCTGEFAAELDEKERGSGSKQ